MLLLPEKPIRGRLIFSQSYPFPPSPYSDKIALPRFRKRFIERNELWRFFLGRFLPKRIETNNSRQDPGPSSPQM